MLFLNDANKVGLLDKHLKYLCNEKIKKIEVLYTVTICSWGRSFGGDYNFHVAFF